MKQASGYMSYYDRIEPMRGLSDEEYGIVRRAIDDYAQYGIIPELPPHLDPFFKMWRPSIDAGRIKYAETCIRRKYNVSVERYKKDDPEKPKFWVWFAHHDYDPNLFKNEDWYELASEEHNRNQENENTQEYKSIQEYTNHTNTNRTLTEIEIKHEHEHEPKRHKYNRVTDGYNQTPLGDIEHMIADI